MTAIPAFSAAAQQVSANLASTAAAAEKKLGLPVSSTSSETPFAGVMRDAIQATQKLETNATDAVAGLTSGSGVDVHTAMIATEKSSLAFEMMLSFRNKAVSAYQQLMGLQF